MKKIIIPIILIACILPVTAAEKKFTINTKEMYFNKDTKQGSVINSFDSKYSLSETIGKVSEEKEIENLSKKTTTLLLGNFNNTNESSEEYYSRYTEYSKLRYNPTVAKDDTTLSGLDEKSEEYKDDILSGFSVPGMFSKLSNYNVIYNSFCSIRVTKSDKLILSTVTLPKVKMKVESSANKQEYETIETNLTIYLYFKKLNDEYKLYYLTAETSDEVEEYLEGIEEKSSILSIAPLYKGKMDMYNYEKLDSISDSEISKITNTNKPYVLKFNSYYNNYLVTKSSGFLIADSIAVTTWSFIEKSLKESQYIVASDTNKSYKIEGIITANIETDLAIIKLSEKVDCNTTIGDSNKLQIEDPVFAITNEIGTITKKGIVTSNQNYINTTIPITLEDAGAPLIDKSGQIIGMITSNQINSGISLSINSKILKEARDKFSKLNYEEITAITLEELKEKYYYESFSKEITKIDEKIIKKFSKIGKIEENIKLELIKVSEIKGTASFRYKNNLTNYIDNMQFATSFISELEKSGYKEIVSSENKKVYQNKKYKVVIMSEFDYLVVVMVKL